MNPDPPTVTQRPVVLGHLPFVRETIESLGIPRVLKSLLPSDPRSLVSHADCVILMILNILQGRVALYKMNDWLRKTDHELLFGDVPPDSFTDDRLAATLDAVFDYGIDDVLSAVVSGYLRHPDAPSEYSVHTDTTTLKLYGEYLGDYEEGEPRPDHGHSKDHRPDLKQLVYGLSLHGAAGIPLSVNLFDGNTSDHVANRFHIDQLAGLLPPQDEVTFVADCKAFDATTIGRVLDAAFHFVTLVPWTCGVRERVIRRALESGGPLPELVREPGRTSADPDHVYRGTSFLEPYRILDPETDEYRAVPLRFLVVESDHLAARFDASLADKLARDRKAFDKVLNKLERTDFACEPDAMAAFRDAMKPQRLHSAKFELVEEEQTVSRPRGRPRAGVALPTKTVWRFRVTSVIVDDAAVEDARRLARFFVLATDHTDSHKWSDQRILGEYRHQHVIEGHTGFRWLKGPAAACPMFLKTPSRIAALGLVFVLALMVRNYIQYTIRRRLKEEDEYVPSLLGRPCQKPTTENVFQYFGAVMLIRTEREGVVIRREVFGLNRPCLDVLRLLGFDPCIFTVPRNSIPASGRSPE